MNLLIAYLSVATVLVIATAVISVRNIGKYLNESNSLQANEIKAGIMKRFLLVPIACLMLVLIGCILKGILIG